MSDPTGHFVGGLVLGTAQLGMAYGIANSLGQPTARAATAIVEAAVERDVYLFDTAQDYGDSEFILGQAFAEIGVRDDVQVISKLGTKVDVACRSAIEASFDASLSRLGIPRLLALLLHDESQLDAWQGGLGESLIALKHDGRISKIGVSVYSPARALQALDMDDVDIIQVPGNVFDRRMARAGVFERAAQRGRSVVVRSVYLQGLALMQAQDVSARVRGGRAAVAVFDAFCARHGLDRRHALIDYVRAMAPGSPLVIGAESTDQVVENCRLVKTDGLSQHVRDDWDAQWPDDDDDILDPRRWQ